MKRYFTSFITFVALSSSSLSFAEVSDKCFSKRKRHTRKTNIVSRAAAPVVLQDKHIAVNEAPHAPKEPALVKPEDTSIMKSSEVSVHMGRASYLRQNGNNKYFNTGVSFEQDANTSNSFLVPRVILGVETNQYIGGQSPNLYDFSLKLGPRFQSRNLEFDLQGLAGMLFNSKGDSSFDAGAQVKVGLRFNKVSTQFYVSRTQSFSRFGLSVGYSI